MAKPLWNFLPLFKALISNGFQGAPSYGFIGIVPASWKPCGDGSNAEPTNICEIEFLGFTPSVTRRPSQSQAEPEKTLTLQEQTLRKAEKTPNRRRNGRRHSATGRAAILLPFLAFVICLFALASWGKQPNTGSAKVEGTVFVQDAAGNQSFVAGASVKFSGPATFETESDENGKYVIAAAPFGTYSVEAIFPGLKAVREVHVEGSEVHVSLSNFWRPR